MCKKFVKKYWIITEEGLVRIVFFSVSFHIGSFKIKKQNSSNCLNPLTFLWEINIMFWKHVCNFRVKILTLSRKNMSKSHPRTHVFSKKFADFLILLIAQIFRVIYMWYKLNVLKTWKNIVLKCKYLRRFSVKKIVSGRGKMTASHNIFLNS